MVFLPSLIFLPPPSKSDNEPNDIATDSALLDLFDATLSELSGDFSGDFQVIQVVIFQVNQVFQVIFQVIFDFSGDPVRYNFIKTFIKCTIRFNSFLD